MSVFAKSLVSTISPSIHECDSQLDSVIAAQNVLLQNLETVSKELQTIAESTGEDNSASLPDLEPQTTKIVNIKKRVTNTIKKVNNIKQRLENLEKGLNKRKNSLQIHETNLNKATGTQPTKKTAPKNSSDTQDTANDSEIANLKSSEAKKAGETEDEQNIATTSTESQDEWVETYEVEAVSAADSSTTTAPICA